MHDALRPEHATSGKTTTVPQKLLNILDEPGFIVAPNHSSGCTCEECQREQEALRHQQEQEILNRKHGTQSLYGSILTQHTTDV